MAAPLPPLPDALLDPRAYPFPVAAVELRETHISWVFLAGNRAYKAKKPVVLPFVDYGTPERRRWCCAEEVRLNRRLAPEVYLGVAGLVPRPAGGWSVGDAADPRAAEHVVAMRRYDEATTLAAALVDRRATAADLERVGARVAAFHAALAPAAGATPLPAVLAETLATLAEAAPEEAGAVARTGAAAEAALAGCAAELAERAGRGLVRDGHGDLRAEHVLLTEPVAAVDTLEFDAGLRVADVAYDLAFLVMDVQRLAPELVAPLLAGHRAAGGDAGTPALLAVLAALRALVRAKVDAVRAGQLRDAEAAERRRRARERRELADRLLATATLPPVLCLAGLAASGKSTVAAELARRTGRPVLSSDVVRKLRAGLDPHERAAAGLYVPEAGPRVYAALGHAAAVGGGGIGVIVDATFRRAADVDAFRAACPVASAWVVCRAPAAVLVERAFRRRGRPDRASDAGPEVVRAQLGETPGPLPLPEPPLAVLDTTQPIAGLVDALLAARRPGRR